MIEKNIDLQMGLGVPPMIAACTEGDTMWRWRFRLYCNGARWTIPSGSTAMFAGRKSDGNVFDLLAAISDNEVVMECTEQITAAPGPVACVVRIMDRYGKTVASCPLVLAVAPNPQTAGPMSETVLSAYNEVLQLLGGAVNVPASVSDWLSEHITQPAEVVIDDSLSVEGAAADAAAVGNAASDLQNGLESVHTDRVRFALVEGEYVKGSGAFGKSAGWSRTGYLPCADYAGVNFKSGIVLNSGDDVFNVWYDENKAAIRNFRISMTDGQSEFLKPSMPENSCYFALSGPTEYMEQLVVTAIKKVNYQGEGTANALQGLVSASSWSKGMSVALLPEQLEFRVIDDESVSRYYRLSTPYYRFGNGSANTLRFALSDTRYSYKVCVYYVDANGEYVTSRTLGWRSGVRRIAPNIKTVDGDTILEEYFAVTFSDAAKNRFLTAEDATAIAKAFSVYEEPCPGKYFRICTFNMARRWGAFKSRSSEDYSAWQIAQYLNLFGEINPDILCMQEALGVTGLYIDAGEEHNFADSVLKHKFQFNSFYGDTRVSSKYGFKDYKSHVYATQYGSAGKSYTKCLVNVEGYSVGLFNTHTEYHGDYDEYLKPQMEELIAAMKAARESGECDYTIACGDFNALSPSDFAIFEENGFTVANCGAFGDKVTWPWIDYEDANDLVTNPDNPDGERIPKKWNMSCLDNVIVSDNVKLQRVGTVAIYESGEYKGGSWPLWQDGEPLAISDHYPLWADVTFE